MTKQGKKRAATIRNKNVQRGVLYFRTNLDGSTTYRAVIKLDGKTKTVCYSRDYAECEAQYLTAYLSVYGVLPYVS